jgi:SAM-dependent methyltransferase
MTILGKLVRSVHEKGVAKTISVCVESLIFYVRTLSPEYRRRVNEQRNFDTSLGVETTGDVTLGAMGEVVGDKSHSGWYLAAPIDELRSVLAGLAGQFQGTTFIDLGCGKGRALFIAAEFPFDKIVGVDFSVKLCNLARKNIESFRQGKTNLPPITVICEDAGNYVFPPTPLCIYMFNPFDGEIMLRAMKNLSRSLDANMRKITILYFNPIENAIVASYFRRMAHIPAPGIFSCTVYEGRVTSA